MKYFVFTLIFLTLIVGFALAVKSGYILLEWDSNQQINLYDHDAQSQCRYQGIYIPQLHPRARFVITGQCIIATETQVLE